MQICVSRIEEMLPISSNSLYGWKPGLNTTTGTMNSGILITLLPCDQIWPHSVS